LKKDFTALEKIYDALKKQCESKNIIWEENVALKGWSHYLGNAYNHSEWLQSNFNTSNILSKINEILANNGKSTTSKQPTGANVDNASALAKLNQMDW
jgi:hypothetical protein